MGPRRKLVYLSGLCRFNICLRDCLQFMERGTERILVERESHLSMTRHFGRVQERVISVLVGLLISSKSYFGIVVCFQGCKLRYFSKQTSDFPICGRTKRKNRSIHSVHLSLP